MVELDDDIINFALTIADSNVANYHEKRTALRILANVVRQNNMINTNDVNTLIKLAKLNKLQTILGKRKDGTLVIVITKDETNIPEALYHVMTEIIPRRKVDELEIDIEHGLRQSKT